MISVRHCGNVVALIVVLIVSIATGHLAWGQSTGATDNELFAAYCMGDLDEQINNLKRLATPDDFSQNQLKGFLVPLLDRRQRFLSYLISTGVMGSSERSFALPGAMLAMQRGHIDEQQCMATMINCNPAAECEVVNHDMKNDPLWLRGPSPAQNKCMGEHLAACKAQQPGCSRLSRCDAPDNLPF